MTTKTDRTTTPLEKARAALAAAEAEVQQQADAAAAARRDRAQAEWRQVLDEYDPRALRADVVAAGDRLTQVAAESGLTAAIVDYLAAMLREVRRASEAESAAATVGAEVPRGTPKQLRDATGKDRGLLDELPAVLFSQAILAAAKGQIDAEDSARQAGRAARIESEANA